MGVRGREDQGEGDDEEQQRRHQQHHSSTAAATHRNTWHHIASHRTAQHRSSSRAEVLVWFSFVSRPGGGVSIVPVDRGITDIAILTLLKF